MFNLKLRNYLILLKLKVVEADDDQALCLVNPDWSNDVAVVLEIIDPRTVKDSPDIARRIAVCVNVCSEIGRAHV